LILPLLLLVFLSLYFLCYHVVYLFSLNILRTLRSTLFPYTTLFRSCLYHLNGKNKILSPLVRLVSLVFYQRRAWVYSSSDKKLRSEEHTSELQSRFDLVCRLLLEKKNNRKKHRRM